MDNFFANFALTFTSVMATFTALITIETPGKSDLQQSGNWKKIASQPLNKSQVLGIRRSSEANDAAVEA